jgi:hypothetical protein
MEFFYHNTRHLCTLTVIVLLINTLINYKKKNAYKWILIKPYLEFVDM